MACLNGGVFTRAQWTSFLGCHPEKVRRAVLALVAQGLAVEEAPAAGVHGIGRMCRIRARKVYRALGAEEFFRPRRITSGAVLMRRLLALDLNKSVADTDLIGAVEALAHGHSYLPQRAAALLAQRRTQGNSICKPGPEVLSSRQLAAIKLYASGFSAREMGEKMFLSPKTVEGYLARAKRKLGLHNRRDIVRFVLEAGLLQAEGER